jgi:hypothetical protein
MIRAVLNAITVAFILTCLFGRAWQPPAVRLAQAAAQLVAP